MPCENERLKALGLVGGNNGNLSIKENWLLVVWLQKRRYAGCFPLREVRGFSVLFGQGGRYPA